MCFLPALHALQPPFQIYFFIIKKTDALLQVATALANLAILYNQQNEFAKAQPLYERALHIFETHYGSDHPEVAHTLTDLAVLHLERVCTMPLS
jgi:tetratricopeptide (TPR) repeat protein